MKKVFLALIAAVALASCTTQKGNAYNNHLKSKHTGQHHLNNGNGGCNWNK